MTSAQPGLDRSGPAGGFGVELSPGEQEVSLDRFAELRPEPDNEYDNRAVGVYVDGRKVGHLSRVDAKLRQTKLLALRSQGKRPMCGALISGGWLRSPGDEGHYGIRLDLDWS